MQRVLLKFKWDITVSLQLAMIALVDFENLMSRVYRKTIWLQQAATVSSNVECCKTVLQCTRVDGGCNAVNKCCLAYRGHMLLLNTRAAYLTNAKQSITNIQN